MPKHRYIILFAGLFFLSFSVKAEEEALLKSYLSLSDIRITGPNVLCVEDEWDTVTLTLHIPQDIRDSFPSLTFRWVGRPGVIPPLPHVDFEIIIPVRTFFDDDPYRVEIRLPNFKEDDGNGGDRDSIHTVHRTIYTTSRPVVTAADRITDTLCPGKDRAVRVGMENLVVTSPLTSQIDTVKYFLWTSDPANESYYDGQLCPGSIPGTFVLCNHWPNPNNPINIWAPISPPPAQIHPSTFLGRMSTHPLRAIGYENHCYTDDSTFVFVDFVDFFVRARGDTIVCQGETVTIELAGRWNNDRNDRDEIIWWWDYTDSIFLETSSTTADTHSINVTSITFKVDEAGQYRFSAELENDGCPGTKDIIITALPFPKDISISIVGDTDTVCRGKPAILTVACGEDEDCSFLWLNKGETTDSITIWPRERTRYSVRVSGKSIGDRPGCHTDTNIVIYSKICDVVYFPNALKLSPSNPDNRIWKPVVSGVAPEGNEYYYGIFDRWGQLIFESNNLDHGWNGTHQGQNVRPGVFVYVFRLTNQQDVWERTGTITVID